MLYNKIMEGMIYMFEYYEDFVDFIGNRLPYLREQKNISARDMHLSLGTAERSSIILKIKEICLRFSCQFLIFCILDKFDRLIYLILTNMSQKNTKIYYILNITQKREEKK